MVAEALAYQPTEEELKESVLLNSERKKLIEAQKEAEEAQEKEPAKKLVKPYSFQKGKK